jgi:hypothetical protein
MATTLPATIDEVLVRLNDILDDSIRKGTRIGYFVGLYYRVTSNVRRALIAGNVFDDGPRMERLDVIFANRFLEAWDQHVRGERPSESWAVAFERLDDDGPLVVQHLMLGMNAHINLDLGIAAATVAPTPPALASLQADFNRINDVLGRLVRVVEDELCQISPRLQRVADLATIEERMFDFGLVASREIAWKLATDLVAAPKDGWPAIVARRDQISALAGRALYPLHGMAAVAARLTHEHESKDIRWNIQVVAE